MRGTRATGRQGLDGYDKSKDAAWEGRAARAVLLRDPPPHTRVLASPGCWCGERFGHDWPGKADGAPHPRDWPGRVNGRGFR